MPGISLRGRAHGRVLVLLALCAAPTLARAQEPAAAPAPADGEAAPAAAEAPPARPTLPVQPAVEVQPLKRARHNWYAGFGFGLGAGNLRRDEAGANRVSFALIGNVRGGGRIRDNLLVGGLLSSTLGGARRGQSLLSAMAEVIGYPVKGKGLQLSAAAGLGVYVQSETSLSSMTMTGSTAIKAIKPGIAFGLGLGYEFWIARRFNLGLTLRADGLGSPQIGLRAAGTLGLSFSWY